MKLLRAFAFSVVVAIAASSLAQSTSMVFDLTTKDNFDLCSQESIRYDHSEFLVWQWNNYGKYPYCYNYNISGNYYDDYLVTPELELKAGELYLVKLSPRPYSSSYKGDVEVLVGQGDDLESYSSVAHYENIDYVSYASSAVAREATFTVPEDGMYKVTFRALSTLYLHNATIETYGELNTPAAVTDLTIIPDAMGENKAEILFTMPKATISGKALTEDLTYILKRGDTLLEENAALPGAKVSFYDQSSTAGNTTYSVTIANGTDLSETASVTAFIGKETPLPVNDLVLSSVGSQHTLSWAAPTVGIHDANIDTDYLSYEITRVLDGVETELGSVTETSFSETIEPVGIQALYYKVVAILGENSSDAASSNVVKIGSTSLPFADSFANAEFSNMWDTEILNLTTNWEARATGQFTVSNISDPFDNDGGLAFYNSFNTKSGGSARLITAPISHASTQNAVIQYYMNHLTAGLDYVKLQISCDSGEFVDIENSEVTVKADETGWTKHLFALPSDMLGDCITYRVALTAVSTYGQNIIIDNVQIFNLLDNDLAISGFGAPSEIVSGNTATFSFNVQNNSSSDVNAADYSLELTTDFPDEIALPETRDIPALGAVSYSFDVPVNALHVKDCSGYSFAVNVNFEPDEELSNNSSDEAFVAVRFHDNISASELEYTLGETACSFSWTPANDTEYVPLNFADSFEDYEADTSEFDNGITILDLDNKAGGTNYRVSGSKFNVCEVFSSVPSKADGSKFLGVTCLGGATQDDWIILPEITSKKTSTNILSMLVGFKSFSYSYYTYSYEVRYATEDYDPANPTEAFSNLIKKETTSSYGTDALKYDNSMYSRSYEVPAGAKYVAIRFTTNISYDTATYVDKLSLTEVEGDPLLGYNLYEVGVGKVNDELLYDSAADYEPEEGFANDTDFFVTAVYNEGEASPSNKVTIPGGTFTGVNNPFASNDIRIVSLKGGVSITSAENVDIAIYDLAGRIVAKANLTGNRVYKLLPGAYIVRAGNSTAKVIIR